VEETVVVGVPGALTALFIVLKLAGVISWSWWLVMSPLLGTLVLAAIMIAAAFVLYKASGLR
jgi:hypothetical protein